MRKNFLAVALIFALAVVLCPATLAADSDFTITDGVLTKYNGAGGDVTIPDGVTSIGNRAFEGCTKLTGVTIPGSVTSIGGWAFVGCTSLTDVTIQNGVTDIGTFAFGLCTDLPNVTIPGSVTSIGGWAFVGCTSLTDITIQNGVTSIGQSAFEDCVGLTRVAIPGSVSSIGGGAFSGCTGLTDVTIQNGVTDIGTFAFEDCVGLTRVAIPDSVTSIGYYAFQSCTGLTSVTIGDGVTNIGEDAFGGCTGLTSFTVAAGNPAYCSVDGVLFNKGQTELLVYPGGKAGAYTIPGGVTSIGYAAFGGCSGLTGVVIPESVTSIEDYVFARSTGLISISVAADNPAYCSIDGVLFNKDQTELLAYPCGKAGAYIIPGGITSIGYAAFTSCAGLTGVTIPDSVTSIGKRAFAFCPNLTSFTVAADNPTYCSVDGVLFSKGQTELFAYPGGKVGAYTVPDGVTSIGYVAFGGCADLTGITIPGSVTGIGDSAFQGCTGLTSVSIPKSIIRIGYTVFDFCDNLTDVYYGGTETQWEAIPNHSQLQGVTIHYNVSLVPAGQAVSGTLESTNSETLPWTYEAGDVTVAAPIPEDETVLVVCFDESGAFTDAKLLSASRLNASIGQPDHFKLIWLGSSLAPQCAAAEVVLTP